MQGTVKWFNATKGFGFVAPEDGGNDVFVHITALNGLRIDEGDVVAFDLQEGRKGQEAVNVSMVQKNPNPPARRSFNPDMWGGHFSNGGQQSHQDEYEQDA